jgi:hypothetical protein
MVKLRVTGLPIDRSRVSNLQTAHSRCFSGFGFPQLFPLIHKKEVTYAQFCVVVHRKWRGKMKFRDLFVCLSLVLRSNSCLSHTFLNPTFVMADNRDSTGPIQHVFHGFNAVLDAFNDCF